MAYRLNLNKTKMRMLVKRYDASVPCMRDCIFTHYRGCYWLRYYVHGFVPMRATVLVSLGVVLVRLLNLDTSAEEVFEVPFSYLSDMEMVKSV